MLKALCVCVCVRKLQQEIKPEPGVSVVVTPFTFPTSSESSTSLNRAADGEKFPKTAPARIRVELQRYLA